MVHRLTYPAAVLDRAKSVRLLSLDVDGVLTDGRLYYVGGDVEAKAFNTQDGAALKMLESTGVAIAIITGRRSTAVERRTAELGIVHLFQGADDKAACLAELCRSTGLQASAVAHVGDDVPDLPLFNRVGFRVSVPDAHPVVLARADYVTTAAAGNGAVREVCHLIMTAQGTWQRALARYDR
jgi:3-deoxy-D-manno-octulosonate 8-phosphate phosphatase (KDO 8-P phosphatase)